MTFSHTAALVATAFCAANAQTVGIEDAAANRGGPVNSFAPLGLGQTLEPLAAGLGGLPCAAPFLVTSFANVGEFNPDAPLLFGGGIVVELTLILNQLTPGARLFEFSESQNPPMSNGVVAEFSERGEALLFKTFDENGVQFAEVPVEASRLTINRETTIRIVVQEIDPLAPRPAVDGAELAILFNGVEVATSLTTAPVVATRMINLIGQSVEGLPVLQGQVLDFSLQACDGVLANAAGLNGKKDNDVATDEVVLFLLIAVGVLILIVAGIVVYLVAQPSGAAAPAKKAASSERSSSRRSSSRRSSRGKTAGAKTSVSV